MAPLKKWWRKMEQKMKRKSGLGSFVPLEPWIATQNAKATGEIKEATLIMPVRRSSSKNPAKVLLPCYQTERLSTADCLENQMEPDVESRDSMRAQREDLEQVVARLEERLQEELDLRTAFEIAHKDGMAAARSSSFVFAPQKAKKLILSVGLLELQVSRLEQEVSLLQSKLQCKRSKDENDGLPETLLERVSERSSEYCIVEKSEPPLQNRFLTENVEPGTATTSGDHRPCRDETAADVHISHPEDLHRDDGSRAACLHEVVSEDLYVELESLAASIAEGSSADAFSIDLRNLELRSLSPNDEAAYKKDAREDLEEQSSSDAFTEETLQSSSTSDDLHSFKPSPKLEENLQHSCQEEGTAYQLSSRRFRMVDQPWHYPNSLSEQMVYSMMDIYQQLCDATNSSGVPGSPVTPFGYCVVSSASSDTSGISRGPLLDRRTKAGLVDSVADPYRSSERLTPPELQAYRLAIQVSCLRVGKSELEYAADALGRFKVLVEHLSKVDASRLGHAEKLAFWINIYNALMMHAFLAYGTPDSDLKYFLIMQKASYVIGGYSFNAATIMHTLLMTQASTYRSFLECDEKPRMTREQLNFGLTHPEPLTVFALSFGAWSCPAVRLYTPDAIHEQLQTALEEFVQASVGICWDNGQVMIPKLLYHYHRDILGGERSALFRWVSKHIPSSQLKGMMQQRNERMISLHTMAQVVPLDLRFRYLFICDSFQAS